eukprot:SAG31_NODE_4318_length_3362_cov_17.927061_5_plen_61_part_00
MIYLLIYMDLKKHHMLSKNPMLKNQIVQLASYLRYHLEGVRLVYLISYSRFRSRLYFSEI